MKSEEENYCPYCHQSMRNASSNSKPKVCTNIRSWSDRFAKQCQFREMNRILWTATTFVYWHHHKQTQRQSKHNTGIGFNRAKPTDKYCFRSSPVQSRSSTFSTDAARPPPVSAQNLNANAFNQGYYSKFFVEMNKLGKGFRGSVFLCEVSQIA